MVEFKGNAHLLTERDEEKKTDGVIHSKMPCFTRGLSAFLCKINKVKRMSETGVAQPERKAGLIMLWMTRAW